MKTEEKISMRVDFEEKVIKNLLTSDADLARRLDSIRRSNKVKEAYAKAEQEVKEKAADAAKKGVNLKRMNQAFAEGIHYSFTLSVLETAINEAVETDMQKSLKKYMLEIMDEDFMLEVIENTKEEYIKAIDDLILRLKASEYFVDLLGGILGGIEEE